MTQLICWNPDGSVETYELQCAFETAFEAFANGDANDIRETIAWYAIEVDHFYGSPH